MIDTSFEHFNQLVLFDNYTFGYIKLIPSKSQFISHRPFLFCWYQLGFSNDYTDQVDESFLLEGEFLTQIRDIEHELHMNPNIQFIQKEMFRPAGTYYVNSSVIP